MSTPRVIVSAPLGGAAGARAWPLLTAIGDMLPARVLLPGASARDLSPIPGLLPAEWEPLRALPHIHLLADAPEAAHALHAALLRPGIAVLEDAGLHQAYRAMTLGYGLAEAWLRQLAMQHGPAASRLGAAALAGQGHPALPRLAPMLEDVTRLSDTVVVRRPDLALPSARHVRILPPAPAPLPPRPPAGRQPAVAGEGAFATAVAARAGAHLVPVSALAEADALLALDVPFSAQALHAPAAAIASGRPVLAWEASLPDDWEHVTRLPWPTDAAAAGAALAAMLAAPRHGPRPARSPADDAADLLSLLF